MNPKVYKPFLLCPQNFDIVKLVKVYRSNSFYLQMSSNNIGF